MSHQDSPYPSSARALSGFKIHTTVLDFPRLMCKFEITSREADEIALETTVLSTFQLQVLAHVISFTSPKALISNLSLKDSVKNSSKG